MTDWNADTNGERGAGARRWWANMSEAERGAVIMRRNQTRQQNRLKRHQASIDQARNSLRSVEPDPQPQVAEAPPAPAPETRNMLSHPQVIQVAAWVERRRSWLETTMPPVDLVARLAADELPFMVTDANVRSTAESLNLNWPRKRRVVSEVMLLMREISLSIADLYGELGTRPSARLIAILERIERDLGTAGNAVGRPLFLDVPEPGNHIGQGTDHA